MLNRVVDNIKSKIQKEVLAPQMTQIPLNYLLTRNIPGWVKHFFDQEVEIWIREEADKFSSSERFDYDLPEVRVLIDKILDILKQTATFDLNQFNRLLERAIKLERDYLIRPHQTLTQFLFKDSFVITTMDVYDMLKYFDKFQYYKDALTDYFNLKYLREISENQFKELIDEIDRQVFEKDPVTTIIKTVKTIIDFLNEGRPPSDTIPMDILFQALRDRNLHDYAVLVQKEAEEGTEEISLNELETLLKTGKTRLERRAPAAREVSMEEVADMETAKPEIQVEEIVVTATSEVAPVEEPEVEEEEEEEEEVEVAAAEPTTAADQLAEVVAEKIKGDKLMNLHDLISRKQRKKFIKKIFRKDETRYTQFVDYLNGLPTWKEASNTIDEMFLQTGINPYSKEALEFSDVVYNRYFPKDRLVNKEDF